VEQALGEELVAWAELPQARIRLENRLPITSVDVNRHIEVHR